jgi:hypothetical protein
MDEAGVAILVHLLKRKPALHDADATENPGGDEEDGHLKAPDDRCHHPASGDIR